MSQQRYHHCRGTVEETAEESAIVDESLLEEALDEVGRLEDPEPTVETINEWGQNSPVPYSEIEVDEPEDVAADSLCE